MSECRTQGEQNQTAPQQREGDHEDVPRAENEGRLADGQSIRLAVRALRSSTLFTLDVVAAALAVRRRIGVGFIGLTAAVAAIERAEVHVARALDVNALLAVHD